MKRPGQTIRKPCWADLKQELRDAYKGITKENEVPDSRKNERTIIDEHVLNVTETLLEHTDVLDIRKASSLSIELYAAILARLKVSQGSQTYR